MSKIPAAAKPAPVKLDPKRVAALNAKVAQLTGSGRLAAAPHSYHH